MTTHSYPAEISTTTQRSRPLQQFFKNVFNALRRTTTPEPSTTIRIPITNSYLSTNNELQEEIPNFVDFSTFLLDSLSANNSAIKFSYMEHNITVPKLNANYSVISFLMPQNFKDEEKRQGIFDFFTSFQLPWNRGPSTVISKFPPVFENLAQRIQSYYSIYKYEDDSRTNTSIVVLIPSDTQQPQDDDIKTTTDYQIPTTTDLFDDNDSTTVEI